MDLKQLLFDHFEKLGLGVTGAFLFGALLVGAFGESPAEASKDKVKKLNATVQDKKQKAEEQAPKLKARDEAERVDRSIQGAPRGEALPAWVFHRKPLVVLGALGQGALTARHLPCENLEGKGRLGSIALSFEEPTCLYDKHARHTILRAVGAAQDWKPVGEVDARKPGEKLAFVDKDCEPGKSYYYRVQTVARVDETAKPSERGRPIELPNEEGVKLSNIAGPFERRPDTYLECVSVEPKPTPAELARDPNKKGSAYLKVWKWDSAAGQWDYEGYSRVYYDETVGKGKYATRWVLKETKRGKVPKKIGGTEVEIDADISILNDPKTKETLELNNVVKSDEVQAINKDKKAFSEEGSEEASGTDGKKPEDRKKTERGR